MGRPPAIPDNIVDELVSRYGEYDNVLNRRRTFEDLAAWLRKKHGIAVSREAVRTVVQPRRAEIAEIRRQVYREEITKNVVIDIQGFDDIFVKLRAMASKPRVSAGQFLAVVDEYRKCLDTKLRNAGLNEPLKLVDVDGEVNGAVKALVIYSPKKVDPDAELGDDRDDDHDE